jgi:hypothetical protein
VPRKSIFGIPDGFFGDHFADLPDNWEALLVEFAFFFKGLLKLFRIKRKLKWIEKRAKGTHTAHRSSKAIVKLIGLVATVIVDLIFLVGRATIAASIGLINTMLVGIRS